MKKIIVLLILTLPLAACVKNNELTALQNRVAALEQRLDTVQPNLADNWAEMQQVQARQGQLEGRMDELERRFTAPAPETLGPSFNGEYTGVVPPPESGISPEEAVELYGDDHLTIPESDMDPAQALYNRALQEFRARNYETAQTLWAEFVQANPHHDLTANAYFWQGECFYQLRDYPEAILAYQQVIQDYPDSSKYPGALLKQGVSFLAIGKDDAGKVVLERLIEQYPNSPEADKAREFLRTN